jgi:hypothetical protein
MATSAQISHCKQIMPRPISLTDAQIGDIIDKEGSVESAAARFWEAKAAETAGLVDITESGSERKNSQVAKQAQDMAKYWREKADMNAPVTAHSPRTRLIERT